jgi:hypothetical protein
LFPTEHGGQGAKIIDDWDRGGRMRCDVTGGCHPANPEAMEHARKEEGGDGKNEENGWQARQPQWQPRQPTPLALSRGIPTYSRKLAHGHSRKLEVEVVEWRIPYGYYDTVSVH